MLSETHPSIMNVGEARIVVKMFGPQHYIPSYVALLLCHIDFLTRDRTRCSHIPWKDFVVWMLRVLNFAGWVGGCVAGWVAGWVGRCASETATTSKERSRRTNRTILTKVGCDTK